MASLTSSTLYGSPMSLSYQGSASSSTRLSHSTLQVLCQQSTVEILAQRSDKVPRRFFAAATVLAGLLESYSAQEAQAAKRKVVEAVEKKPDEDKSLGAYDAKLLATYRRKEAMKEAMAKLREKGKPKAVEPTSVAKPEAAPKAEPEPAASVAASASEAYKEAIE